MVYHAKIQSKIIVFLFGMLTLNSSITTNKYEEDQIFLRIALYILLLVFVFIRYKFKMEENYINFQIQLFAIPIYKKEIEPNQINQIKFIRVGWAQKGAIIQLKKGLNIRVIHFEPKNVYTDLIYFANENSIKLFKTKDYMILEKMKLREE